MVCWNLLDQLVKSRRRSRDWSLCFTCQAAHAGLQLSRLFPLTEVLIFADTIMLTLKISAKCSGSFTLPFLIPSFGVEFKQVLSQDCMTAWGVRTKCSQGVSIETFAQDWAALSKPAHAAALRNCRSVDWPPYYVCRWVLACRQRVLYSAWEAG